MANRKFSPEFRDQVVHAVIDTSRTVADVARGYSLVAQTRVLRVILRPVGHARDGSWYGLTAHSASARDRLRYEERA